MSGCSSTQELQREYYHEHKAQVKCAYCGNEYSCVSGLVKHQKGSQKCKVIKLQKYIDEMDGKLLCGKPFEGDDHPSYS